jgi:L,D-transpeptidase ErfK/SrfK
MKKVLVLIFAGSISFFSCISFAKTYGQQICENTGYRCHKVVKGDSWQSLFPDEEDRLIAKKVNRMNTNLQSGMTIAIPVNLDEQVLDYAPFPHKIDGTGDKVVKVDLSDLAWGAYDEDGDLLNWGPIRGSFTVYRKQGEGCVSSKFPLGRGGAPMPYCMHFSGGYALHGSPSVPGYNASHGCVRLFTDDARWLNHNFVDVGATKVNVTE